jgi:F-type H+-transporting ATPase subunit alpha
MLSYLRSDHADVLTAIRDSRELGKDTEGKLKEALGQFAKTFA